MIFNTFKNIKRDKTFFKKRKNPSSGATTTLSPLSNPAHN